jgi:DeoR family suf operon transcriptional repressor
MTFSWEFANTPAGRVLRAIQMRGQATIKDVAHDLGVTASAVRLHLTQLEAKGAIQAEPVREGVGRPYYLYSATPEAHNLFYKDYGELASLLLQEVHETEGPDALQRVLRRVSERLAATYRDEVAGQELGERVDSWVELLDRRGVAVQLERTGEGFVLREYGCPYQNVAVENRCVCEMERQVMVRLLESGVELRQCILDGSRGCQFVIVDGEEIAGVGARSAGEKNGGYTAGVGARFGEEELRNE